MPILEVRRHSIRKTDGGSQLSQAGVALARRIGADLGMFERVVTTVSPRSRETAIAMGFAVDYELVTLRMGNSSVYDEVCAFVWDSVSSPFVGAAQLISNNGSYTLYAHSLAALLRDIMTPLKSEDTALFIGHAGELEAALVACFPDEAHELWGGMFKPMEGARLTFSGEPARFTHIELIRLDE